jgi:hypothetical protein
MICVLSCVYIDCRVLIVDLVVVQYLKLEFRNIYWIVVGNLKSAVGSYASFVLVW